MATNYLNAKNGIEIWHKDGITQLLAGDYDPSIVGQDAAIGSIYMSSMLSGTIYKKEGIGEFDWSPDYSWTSQAEAVSNFVELTDTPATYSGSEGKILAIDSLASEIEFIDAPGIYPRYYIEYGLHINVHDWGQYVIHDTALEVAGTLELGTCGMIILT